MAEEILSPETVKTECKFGTVSITKEGRGYALSFTPYGSLNGYTTELGDADQGPAAFTQAFDMFGAPFEFLCVTTDQQNVLDALKSLVTGTDKRYVLQQLNKIPR